LHVFCPLLFLTSTLAATLQWTPPEAEHGSVTRAYRFETARIVSAIAQSPMGAADAAVHTQTSSSSERRNASSSSSSSSSIALSLSTSAASSASAYEFSTAYEGPLLSVELANLEPATQVRENP
jgi:hypothetical protein